MHIVMSIIGLKFGGDRDIYPCLVHLNCGECTALLKCILILKCCRIGGARKTHILEYLFILISCSSLEPSCAETSILSLKGGKISDRRTRRLMKTFPTNLTSKCHIISSSRKVLRNVIELSFSVLKSFLDG